MVSQNLSQLSVDIHNNFLLIFSVNYSAQTDGISAQSIAMHFNFIYYIGSAPICQDFRIHEVQDNRHKTLECLVKINKGKSLDRGEHSIYNTCEN